MSSLLPDSFDTSAFGKQLYSKQKTGPAHGFGTGDRTTASTKVYMGGNHEKMKRGLQSPGPGYNVPSTVGDAAAWSFGTDEQRKHPKSRYPDSSVDLVCADVDTQKLKYDSTKLVHFGTEAKGSLANAEAMQANPGLMLGREAPGALEYYAEKAEPRVCKQQPAYSFAPPVLKDKKDKGNKEEKLKPVTRLILPPSSSPRHLGPGSHRLESSLGRQPRSARGSGPSYTMGHATPRTVFQDKSGQILDISPDLTSLGKQVVSRQPTMPRCTFGGSTRETVARSQLVMHALDAGPRGNMPKPHHHVNLPKPPLSMGGSKPGI